MSKIKDAIKSWPVKSRAVRLELMKISTCPECGNKLDHQSNCEKCNFDGVGELKLSPAYEKYLGNIVE